MKRSSKTIKLLTTLLLSIFFVHHSYSQPSSHTKKAPTEPVDLYFWEYLPPGYDPAKVDGYPLLVFLHGVSERAVQGANGFTELDKVLRHGPPKEIQNGNEMCFRVQGVERCFIVLSPQLTDDVTYWSRHPSELIEYAMANLNVDLDRIYVTGLSMGGIGTIDLVQGSWPNASIPASVAVAPGGGADISKSCLFSTRDIAFWAVHGRYDTTQGTPWGNINNLVNGINECSNPVPTPLAHLTTIETSAHNVWTDFYRTDHSIYFPNVYEWFLLNPKNASETHPLEPGVDAGSNKGITSSNTTLAGSAGDNEGGTIVSTQWTKQSGPSAYQIVDPSSLNTSVTGLISGTYVFRLTVTDNDNQIQYDEVTINVATATAQVSWHSYEIQMQSLPSEQGVILGSDNSTMANVEFYESANPNGVDKASLFTVFTEGPHSNTDSHAEDYWAHSSGYAYPFAGISTVGRGADDGEGLVPNPTGVMDLQLHPPNNDNLTVAAFIAPLSGNYTVSNLAARRVSANIGTAAFKIFDQHKNLIDSIQVTNDQKWVTHPDAINVGFLNQGDRLYFATDYQGKFNSDFTEVTWSITYDPVPQQSESWHSYDIVMQADPSQQGVISGSQTTTATIEFYESTNDNGVNKTSLFSTFTDGLHSNPDSRATDYWAHRSGYAYPFAGVSTVARGDEPGEGNTPSPSGVLDLQLHPPNNNHLTVAAFVVPVNGSYSISHLGARRVSSNVGTAAFKVFDQNKVLIDSLQVTENQDWVVHPAPISVGTLTQGDRIYFATDYQGQFNSDFTEVTWTITLASVESNAFSTANSPNRVAAASTLEPTEKQVKESQYVLYPNPVTSTLILTGFGTETDMKVYDSQRNLLLEQRIYGHQGGSYELNTTAFLPGTYYILFKDGNNLHRMKFIKE